MADQKKNYHPGDEMFRRDTSPENKKRAAERRAKTEADEAAARAEYDAFIARHSKRHDSDAERYAFSENKNAAAKKGLQQKTKDYEDKKAALLDLKKNTARTDAQTAKMNQLQQQVDAGALEYQAQQMALKRLQAGASVEDLGTESTGLFGPNVNLQQFAEIAAREQAETDWKKEEARMRQRAGVVASRNTMARAQERAANGSYETSETMMQDHVNRGYSAHQIGPNGIITSDKNYYEAWKKLIQGNFGAKATFNDGLDRGKYAEYGNNYFMLYTYYPGFEGFLTADGVMQEMPAISMSTEWENSPAASVGEELDKALNNEFLEFCAMKTTNANTPIMRRKDALTSRCYKDTGDISFQLKFRVYPGQKVGTQALTTAQEWLLLLSMTTPINAACSFSIDNTIGTVVKAADGIAAAFKAVKDGISGTNSKDKEKQQQQQAALVRAEATLGAEGATALKSFENADARITNPNVFGACLFGIRLYPWIFKKPLTCYISSWSVTPSKEWNEDQFVNDHYYYDFTLNCSMDQKPCANTWRFDYFKV